MSSQVNKHSKSIPAITVLNHLKFYALHGPLKNIKTLKGSGIYTLAINAAIILHYILIYYASQIYLETYLKCLFLYACFNFLCYITFSFSFIYFLFPTSWSTAVTSRSRPGQIKDLKTLSKHSDSVYKMNPSKSSQGWLSQEAFYWESFLFPEVENRQIVALNEDQILQWV